MRVLSLFDGISCGQVALERAGFKPSVYMASEIEKEAIKVTQSNYPKTLQLGGVVGVNELARAGLLGQVDLLMGGSPCQGFSKAGAGKGFDDPRSQLLFNYISIKAAVNPRWFLLENVRMSKRDMDFVTALMGVEPVEINSALFSAQRRKRIYWTNIPIAPIVDQMIEMWMITGFFPVYMKQLAHGYNPGYEKIVNKSPTITTSNWQSNNLISDNINGPWRKPTVHEVEALQTLPKNYCSAISPYKAHKAIGNGWTVDVIAHILRGMR